MPAKYLTFRPISILAPVPYQQDFILLYYTGLFLAYLLLHIALCIKSRVKHLSKSYCAPQGGADRLVVFIILIVLVGSYDSLR